MRDKEQERRHNRDFVMKLTHLLAGIAVAAGAVYGGVKGYIHYRVKSNLDDAIASARPFVSIQYQGIRSDLSGSVTVEGINLRPLEIPERLRIDALTLEGPDLRFLLNGLQETQQRGELPERFHVRIRGLHLATDGPFFEAVHTGQQELAERMGVALDGCSLGQLFGTKDYQALGLDELVLDADFGYRTDQTAPGIELQWHYAARGMESADLSLELSGVSRSLGSWIQAAPRFKSFQLSYRLDPDFVARAIDYCADLRGVSSEEYLTQLTQEPDELYMASLGFVPGPGIRNALQSMLHQSGELVVDARPAEPLELTELQLYHPTQIPDLIGLQVKVGEQPVEDLSASMLDLSQYVEPGAPPLPSDQDNLWARLFGAEASPAEDSLGSNSAPARPDPPRYRKVASGELKDHIGKSVRIQATGGRKRYGRLKSVRGGVATLEERVYGGRLTASIRLREIVKAEVFF